MLLISFSDISVIIPVKGPEPGLKGLLQDLKALSKEMEIIVAKPERGVQNRALQMNTGAKRAVRPFLWFLHADTRLPVKAGAILLRSLNRRPDSLHYFNLKFWDGPLLMFINEIGCWVRSRLMGVPFGDQGFCLKREIFTKLGGFPENVPYGEDHLLVWRARQNGVRLHCTGTFVVTSARRYTDEGWLRITARYAVRWTRQAWPEWRRGVLS